MKLSLISFNSSDKIILSGLLYTPSAASKKAVIWLHGMGDGSVFYSVERTNALGEALARAGIASLIFNNRGGGGYKKTLRVDDDTLPEEDRFYQGGTHYELISDCIKDIDGAVRYLKQFGYSELYLVGHSTGANKICVYHAIAKNSPFAKYVLAGPGDDSGLFYNEIGSEKFWAAINYASKKLKEDKPLAVMPKYSGMHPFSAQSAIDILSPDGDYNTFPFYEATTKRLGKKPLFEEFGKIDVPTLIIFGQEDEYAYTAGGTDAAIRLFKKYANSKIAKHISYQTVLGADHSFHGFEKEFASRVSKWLSEK